MNNEELEYVGNEIEEKLQKEITKKLFIYQWHRNMELIFGPKEIKAERHETKLLNPNNENLSQ